MKFAPYSFSKISTHKQCNRKFKYSFIDKIPRGKTDITPLLKGRAVHAILDDFPEKSSHKLADKYQHIADKFIATETASKYIYQDSLKEFRFGLSKKLEPTSYSDKTALFRGIADHVCFVEEYEYETIEIESDEDIPEGYERV